MARHTFDTTPAEEDAITAARLVANQALPEDRRFVTNADFVAAYVRTDVMAPVVRRYVETRLNLVADTYRTATPEQRAAAEAALGL